ncbi:hypothetical protein MIND_00458700 [Mycena indigotica]|uniref:Uncharacterized protein n=1 Tax=Mycena indigotica TaxID=2126181 RepID=A0A8H6SXV8_9AGAR|nr:uncharacterized protein MIND_00458700 [Mycena indigotica]KAF7306671.1 hypothetical protein MIND_00458700 [Mycena indigotica]
MALSASDEAEAKPSTPTLPSPSIPATSSQSPTCRPILVYTRSQLLHLQASPLVKPPTSMPELKHWFGDHEPSQNKKDSEPSTPNGTRERRFRRDAEDGEASSRPSFRSTLSQPSQMGNFKHQSLRDRERDRDADKERERDLRDKEGQERLRNLSDKYDRDRLAAPGGRNKERDIAPHLSVEAATRGSTQLTTAPRRGEREPREGTKKKVGESNEDWRRVGNSRANRDDGETGRPRARDGSRSRRDHSSSRRERDRDDDKEDHRRTRDDRRRDEHRRERDRDADKEEEVDDPRRWRDDGKRDERMAARRAADRHDKASQENGDNPADRRWTVVEEREARTKRNHRDRRAGGADEAKDKEREKDKEPAWMDTYIPESSGSTGILGGKAPNGELDGIQAWKKGIKEKEKAAASAPTPKKQSAEPVEKPMDEIQLFRMMMKREEEKKLAEGSSPDPSAAPKEVVAPPPGIPNKPSQFSNPILSAQLAKPPDGVAGPSASPSITLPPAHDPNSLLSILGKAEQVTRTSPLINPSPNVDLAADPPPASSRFFPNPINSQNSTIPNSPATDPPQFNPPAGSRVLAFGTRSAGKPANFNGLAQPEPTSSALASASILSNELSLNQPSVKTGPHRSGFSPFDDPTGSSEPLRRTSYGLVAEPFSDRFAKYFDSKNREPPVTQSPVGFTSPSPNQSQRDVNVGYNPMEHRVMDGLLSKLNSSAQIQRPNILNSAPSPGFSQQAQQHNLQMLQQQQQMQMNSRLDSLYDSRVEFVPDGMVPGLRSAPPPRSRDNGMYSDSLEDTLHFSQPRLQPQPQPHRLDPMYNPVYGGRNTGIPIQPQYRGAPSPISQQRLPPGLANLGGRPPLESSQFMGMPPQQQFANNFAVNSYGQPQMRPVPPQHQLANLGHGNPALLGLGGIRGGGGFGGQQGQQIQHALREQQLLVQQRQQQQQQLPPHMLNHHLQPHQPAQGNGQPDLMALLMAGHRD